MAPGYLTDMRRRDIISLSMSFNKIPVVTVMAAFAGAGTAPGQTFFGAAYIGPGGTANTYIISPVNGSAAALIGPMHADTVSAMAFAPDHTTLYAIGHTNSAGFALLRVNTLNGASTVVGPTGVSGAFQDMDFRPSDGKLFGYNGGSIYTISTSTGGATLVGDTGKFPFGDALAFSSSNILYNANESTLDVINQSNGSVTSSTPLTYSPAFGVGFTRPSAMKFHPNGTLYASIVIDGSSRTWALGNVNVGTGAVTRVGTTVSGLDALAIGNAGLGPTPTPAPTSWLLVTIGIAAVALYRRIRRTGWSQQRRL
jgi:hypothetical protein